MVVKNKKNGSDYSDVNHEELLSKVIQRFESLYEIEELKKNDKYKYVGRNLLGVRKYDDWINNLEIGNVMHLNPITPSELL